VRELAEDLHTGILGSLDWSETVQQAEEQGKTVAEAFPDSAMAAQYRLLADQVLTLFRETRPMLKRLLEVTDWSGAETTPAEASFPALFPSGWNSTHPPAGTGTSSISACCCPSRIRSSSARRAACAASF
jgi:hypothetical protein